MGRVKEYIGCKSIEAADCDGKGNNLYSMWLTDTEVVRCRDCENKTKNDSGGISCKHFRLVDRFGFAYYAPVKPDGFCAWGERRLA